VKREVTVYSKDDCVQCDRTKAWLDKNEVPFDEVDLIANPATLEAFKEEGFSSAPIVTVKTTDPGVEFIWAGFIPDNLKKYTHSTKEAA